MFWCWFLGILGVSLILCSVFGFGFMFSFGEDEMEFGLGKFVFCLFVFLFFVFWGGGGLYCIYILFCNMLFCSIYDCIFDK